MRFIDENGSTQEVEEGGAAPTPVIDAFVAATVGQSFLAGTTTVYGTLTIAGAELGATYLVQCSGELTIDHVSAGEEVDLNLQSSQNGGPFTDIPGAFQPYADNVVTPLVGGMYVVGILTITAAGDCIIQAQGTNGATSVASIGPGVLSAIRVQL
jgi:hypothetical protein